MAWCGTKKASKILKMDPDDIIVFDLETTKKFPQYAEILQISIVNGNGKSIFSSYVKPDHAKTWKEAEKINHISPAMVENAPTFSEIRIRIQDIFNNAKLICGYNIKSFDIPILKRYKVVVEHALFDVMEEYVCFCHPVGRHRLIDCAEFFGHSYYAHDAQNDAVVTAYCMHDMLMSDGFINTSPPQKRKPKSDSMQEECSVPDQSKKRFLFLSRFLFKKRGFNPLIIGLILAAVTIYALNAVSGGSIAAGNMDYSILINMIKQDMRILAAAVISILLILYGGIRLLIELLRRIRNIFTRITYCLFRSYCSDPCQKQMANGQNIFSTIVLSNAASAIS